MTNDEIKYRMAWIRQCLESLHGGPHPDTAAEIDEIERLALRAEVGPMKLPSMDEVQLACGNFSPNEFRAVQAVLKWIEHRIGMNSMPEEK